MKHTKLKKADILTLKSKLKKKKLKKKDELKTITSLLKDQKEYMKGTEMDYDPDASKIRNREMLKNMKRRIRTKLDKYDVALEKIKKGTYGFCEKTGKEISKARLMVLPEARTCIWKK